MKIYLSKNTCELLAKQAEAEAVAEDPHDPTGNDYDKICAELRGGVRDAKGYLDLTRKTLDWVIASLDCAYEDTNG